MSAPVTARNPLVCIVCGAPLPDTMVHYPTCGRVPCVDAFRGTPGEATTPPRFLPGEEGEG